jgi:hypothetical protein
LVVGVGGSPTETIDGPAEGSSSWVAESYDFTATATSEVLTFTSNNVGGNAAEGNELTAVALVPEPASWALMLMGVAGVGAGLRLGRRSATSLA